MITTKLVPPRYRRKLVERKRLTDQLEDESYRSLIFVKAASGFGKTALLTQWRQVLVANGCKVGWINLDDSDNKESQFLAYVIAALQKAGCAFGQGALAVYQYGEPGAIDAFAMALVNDLAELDDEIYLVLEDFHCITNKVLQQLVERLLLYAPTNFHFVISSRTELPFSMGQLRIHDRVAEVGVVALRFTHDETHSLLSDRLTEKLDPERARALYDATEGWVAGIQMLSMAWRGNGELQFAHDRDTASKLKLSESILQSTFERMAPATTAFLLQVAIFDRFTPALCEDVIGVSHAGDILDRLASDGIMLVPLDHDEQWFRFHPLFTDYLRRRLVLHVADNLGALHAKARQCLEQNDPFNSPQFAQFLGECRESLTGIDLRALHLRASDWFERHGFLSEAVQHALNAGETRPAYDLIERCALSVVADGGLNTVLAWVASMPAEELAGRWRLRLAHFWALVYSSNVQGAAVEAAALAAGVGVASGITPFEYVVCQGAIACLSERNADVPRLAGIWPPTGDAFHNAIACNVLIYAYLSGGDVDAFRAIQAWQREKPMQTRWSLTYAWNHTLIAWHSMLQGDVATAEATLRKAVQLADKKYGRRSSPACAPAGYLAILLYETNALPALEDLLAGRLDVMNHMAFFESLVCAYETGARLRYGCGDVNAAYELLDQLHMYGTSKGLRRPVAAALGQRVRMALLQQDQNSAFAFQRRLEEIAAPYGDEQDWPALGNSLEIPVIARLSRVRCTLARGDHAGALALLEVLRATPVVAGRFDVNIRLQLLRALALALAKDSANACTAMLEVLKLTARAGMVRMYLDEGEACTHLIRLALTSLDGAGAGAGAAADALKAHARTILDAGQHVAESPAAAVVRRDGARQVVHERLSAREKDVLQYLVQGMPNKRIATTMNVSIDTVKWHLKNLFSKLDVADRLQAVDKARQTNILQQDG